MSNDKKTAALGAPLPGGGNVTVVFSSAGGLGSYTFALQPVASGSGWSGYVNPSNQPTATGTLSPGVYTGVLEASGAPSSMLYASTTFTGDVTLVYGPMVTVLEDG